MATYCTLCGNEEVSEPGIGPLCKPWLEGPMQMAYDAMVYVRENWGEHCPASLGGTFAFGRTHEERIRKFGKDAAIRLHPKMYGESSYTLEGQTKPIMYAECGIRFGLEGASCYWIFDNDTIGLSEGRDLDGLPIPYRLDGETFLANLAAILETAAEQAYMSDHLICEVCGGHYYSPNGPCCEGGDAAYAEAVEEVV